MPKWSRWKITEPEKTLLEDSLSRSPFPDLEERSSLSALLNKSERQVRVWFQNQRQRADAGGGKVESLPMDIVLVSCAYEGVLTVSPAECVRLADAALASLSSESREAFADRAVWARIIQDAMTVDVAVSRDDAITVAATAFLQRVARCFE